MSSPRKLWLLGSVVAALVALLALSRGASRDAGPVPVAIAMAECPAASAAGIRDAAVAESAVEEVAKPRHPEIGFRDRARLGEHFRKHGRETGAPSPAEYLRQAQALRDRARGPDLLEFVRNDAVTCRFERSSGDFVAFVKKRIRAA